jgi:hypothetical protein
MVPASDKKKKHKNKEKTVRCPVEDCDEKVLARGLHLHIRQSAGNGHEESGEIPSGIDLDDAEAVGTREVEMEYPEKREGESVQRLCPYCERPFRGKQGVMIHLGTTAGRKNHPKDAVDRHELDDFPVVRVDENDNVTEVVEEGTSLPSTERRQEQESGDTSLDSVSEDDIREHIQNLREQGLNDEADRAEKMLLGE